MFAPWIGALLEAAAPRVIVEVGIATGDTTVRLLELASKHDGTVHAIDPSPQPEFNIADLKERFGHRFVLHQTMSLEALKRIPAIDAILIDGDHNWYTVYSELKLLEKRAAEQDRPFPLTLVHDVDWPYGRRDLYYNVNTIPEEHRQPYRKGGIVPGEAELSRSGGFNFFLDQAILENTPRNGVRTAVEDFLSETELSLRFQSVVGFHGVGIILPEKQVEENEALCRQLEYLHSAEFLSDHSARIEWGRSWAATLHDKLRMASSRLALEEEQKANPKPVFIIGPPKSGGDVLRWALGQHPDLLPLEETGWLAKFAHDMSSTYRFGRQGAQLPLMGIKEPEFFATFANSINELILRNGRYDSPFARDVEDDTPLLRYRSPADPKTRWIDCSPEYSLEVYSLLTLFPEARFIFMLRDVHEVAGALMGLDRAASGVRTAEFAFKEWERFTRACVQAERAYGSEAVFRLRYTDLVSDTERALRRCLAFLDEPFERDCLEPVKFLTGDASEAPDQKVLSHGESPTISKAISFSEELLAEEPEFDPDLELQVALGAPSAEVAALPVDGPISQRGPATGLAGDLWVDSTLTALVHAEEDVIRLTVEADLPVGPPGEHATLFLTVNENEFRETFPLGRQISWTVPCRLRENEHADLRLRSSRTVNPNDEGLGTDERDLVCCLYRLSFVPEHGQPVDLTELPLEGPVTQLGPAIGISDDYWVDGSLAASFSTEEDIAGLTIVGDLPEGPKGEEATLFLTVNKHKFRRTFLLGERISWSVLFSLRAGEQADLNLSSSRTVCPGREGFGSDERDLVLFLSRLFFYPQHQEAPAKTIEASA